MTADFFEDTLTATSRNIARRRVTMAKKKSKAKKRPVAKAKRTAAKAKLSKKAATKKSSKAKTVGKAKKVAKKSAKPATKKAKSVPAATKTAKKKVAKKKVVPPTSVAAAPAPIVEPPLDTESAPISEPTAHDIETAT
jgi:hypothetical protein